MPADSSRSNPYKSTSTCRGAGKLLRGTPDFKCQSVAQVVGRLKVRKFSLSEDEIRFQDGTGLYFTGYGFAASSHSASHLEISSVRRAIKNWCRLHYEDAGTLGITRHSDNSISNDYHSSDIGDLIFGEHQDIFKCTFLLMSKVDEKLIKNALGTVTAARPGLALSSIDSYENQIDEGWVWTFDFVGKFRGWTLGDLEAWSRTIQSLLNAFDGAEFGARSVRACVDAGHFEVLLGLPETDWLEAKSQPYGADEHGMFELAKDISSFANGRKDAILVIGAKTKKTNDQDVIEAVHPMDRGLLPVRRWRDCLLKKMYPPPAGLVFQVVTQTDLASIAYIFIPKQSAALQPFLVQGSVVSGRVRGALVGLWSRVDDGCPAVSASELHGQLLAAKAYLAGRESAL